MKCGQPPHSWARSSAMGFPPSACQTPACHAHIYHMASATLGEMQVCRDAFPHQLITRRCAVTLNWDTHFKDHNTSRVASVVRGQLGVALLPGSTRVWDRSVDEVRSCTPTLCPTATPSSGSQPPANSPPSTLSSVVSASFSDGSAAATGGTPPLLDKSGPPGAPLQPLPSQNGSGRDAPPPPPPQLLNQPGFSAFPLDRIFYDTAFSLPQQSGGGVMLIKVGSGGSVSGSELSCRSSCHHGCRLCVLPVGLPHHDSELWGMILHPPCRATAP